MANGEKQNDIILESVDGIEIAVDKSEKVRDPLPLKEWLLAEIANISKQLPTKKGWNANLNWEFALKDEQFEGRKMWLNTSMIASSGSKLYNYYLAVMGLDDLEDGAIIRPSDMIGKICYIMVVNSTKKKGKQLIGDIKNYTLKGEPKDKIEEVKTSDTKKESVVKNDIEKKEQSKNDDEIDIENIDLENL